MPKVLVGEFMIRKIRNIRVVAIAPGYVNTAILKNMNQEALAAILKDVHRERLVEPQRAAPAWWVTRNAKVAGIGVSYGGSGGSPSL